MPALEATNELLKEWTIWSQGHAIGTFMLFFTPTHSRSMRRNQTCKQRPQLRMYKPVLVQMQIIRRVAQLHLFFIRAQDNISPGEVDAEELLGEVIIPTEKRFQRVFDIPPTLKHIFQGKQGASPSHAIALSGRAGLLAGAVTAFGGWHNLEPCWLRGNPPGCIYGRAVGRRVYGGFNIAFDVLTPFSNILDQAFMAGLILEAGGKAAAGTLVTWLFERTIYRSLHHFIRLRKFQRYASGQDCSLSNTEFEYDIFEFGSYDPNLSAFIPMPNLGSINSSSCVSGFDQTAFVLGSTGNVFPAINASLKPNDSSVLELEATSISTAYSSGKQQSSLFQRSEKKELLSLADGAIDGANLPLQALLAEARGIQAIIAIDASGDTDDNFAAGNSLIAESKRAALFPGACKFPRIPANSADFVAQNLTTQPTFFGCNEVHVPLILYFPNGAPPPGQVPLANVSGQLSFPDPGVVQAIIDQAGEIVLRGHPQNNEARDPLFSKLCVSLVGLQIVNGAASA
ncbi:acyl transferase/acyl hydrolase/lysophospholipase [Mycena pura]|uniref:Lysophospholipase n=1 Tax=Mycena pura TaxID=153505 RepID=A0AAD6VV16_9AGAR|nr:acyl transferase/acyl hydrolase/lysophospholipase [Mycena pura]